MLLSACCGSHGVCCSGYLERGGGGCSCLMGCVSFCCFQQHQLCHGSKLGARRALYLGVGLGGWDVMGEVGNGLREQILDFEVLGAAVIGELLGVGLNTGTCIAVVPTGACAWAQLSLRCLFLLMEGLQTPLLK